MASLKLGEGYVELFVDDRRYHPAMARAEAALNRLGQLWKSAFSGGNAGLAAAAVRLGRFTQGVDTAANSVRGLTRAFIAMNAAMGGNSASSITSVINAMAAYNKAVGQAQGTVIRAQGSRASQVIRANGSLQSQIIRAQGSHVAQIIRASGAAARSMLSGMAGVVRAVLSPINGAIRGVSGLGRSAMGMVGRALNPMMLLGGVAGGFGAGMFAKTARDESIEIEARLVNLGRIADVSGEQLGRLGGQLKELARTMPGVKLGDIFDISTMAAKMGVGTDILPNFTRDLAKMSVVLEDMPIEVATERIGRLITVFEKGPQDAIRFASALNALDIASTASADDILNITTRFAGMAKAFNATPAQAMAWATAIRQAGVPLETSGTATQQIISRLASRKDMGRFARIAGMDKDSFRGVLDQNPIEAMQRVLKGLKQVRDTAGPSGLSQTMDKLHLDGQRVRGAFLQMIPVVDELNKYLQIAEGDWESLDSVERGYAAKSKTTRAQLELLANNFKLFAASIGDRLMPVVRKLGDGLTFLFQDIEKYFNGEGGAVVERWADRVGDALHKVAVVWREWPTFLELAQLTVQEKVGQIAEVFSRLPTLLGNVARMTGFYLNALFTTLGDKLGVAITKGIFGALVRALDEMPTAVRRMLGIGDEQMAVFRGLSRIQDERPLPKLGDHFTQKGLYEGLPNGLFGALPNRDAEQAARVNQLSEAERRLAEERRKAAVAAEAEAAALRKKPELTGPPREAAGSRHRMTFAERSRMARRAAGNAMMARRRAFNRSMGLGQHAPRAPRLRPKVDLTGPPDFRREEAAKAAQRKAMDQIPVASRNKMLGMALGQIDRWRDAMRSSIDREHGIERPRQQDARKAIRDTQERERRRQEDAMKAINDRKKAEGTPVAAIEELRKGVASLSKAFADLQRNGVPLALS